MHRWSVSRDKVEAVLENQAGRGQVLKFHRS